MIRFHDAAMMPPAFDDYLRRRFHAFRFLFRTSPIAVAATPLPALSIAEVTPRTDSRRHKAFFAAADVMDAFDSQFTPGHATRL